MITFTVATTQRQQFVDITGKVQEAVRKLKIDNGVVCVFIPHTTAAVTINENADPDVVSDVMMTLDDLVPNRRDYRHAEGNSDAHAKSSLIGCSALVIVENSMLRLGVWQSIYFAEFDGPRPRQVWVKSVS